MHHHHQNHKTKKPRKKEFKLLEKEERITINGEDPDEEM